MPAALTLDQLDALAQPAPPPVTRSGGASQALTLDQLDGLAQPPRNQTAGATPGFTPTAAAEAPAPDDPEHYGFFRSMYHESAEPLVGLVKDSIDRGDYGKQAAKDILSGFTRELSTFAAHPDIRNLPLIGTGASATAAHMAKQFDAGNYKGMIGSAAGFLAPFVAPEAFAASAGARAAVGGAAADAARAAADAAGDAAGAAGGVAADAGTAARAAAPDLGKAAANAAAAYVVHKAGLGMAADLLGYGTFGKGGLQALGRSGRAALDAWQQARGMRTAGDYWQQFDRAGAESSAEAAAPPVWEPGPAAEPTSQAWEPGGPETQGTPRPPAQAAPVTLDGLDALAHPPTPFDLAPDARASLPPELVAKVDQLRDLTHAAAQPLPETPGLTPEQRLADRIDEHTAFLRMQAQDLEWGNRAAKADKIAGHLIKNNMEPTDANLAAAAKALAYKDAPSGDAADMVRDRVEWAQDRKAAPAAAGPVELEGNVEPEPADAPTGSEQSGSEPGGLDERATGTRAPLPGPVRLNGRAAPAAGNATAIDVPGEERQYAAHYEVRELDDLQPSHHGETFQRNPKYEGENDRNYDDPNNQQKVVEWATPAKFRPKNLINTAPDTSTGPPAVDPNGNVLGGNGRTMIMQRVYGQSPAQAAAYRTELDAAASHFGIDPESYAHMKQPVLVRVVDEPDIAVPATRARAVTDFNKVGTAALTPAERAIADARGVSQGTLDDVAQRIEHAGDEGEPGTLAQALEGKGGVQVLQKLIDDGVISPQERADLANESQLTRSGRERISNLMLGRYFTNAQQLDNLPASIRGKMERLAAPLARVEGDATFSLSPTMREALDLLDAADAHGAATIGDFIHQHGLFEDRQYSPASVALAEQLKTRTPNALTDAMRQYAKRAKESADMQGAANMFGDKPMTRGEAFDESFGPEALKRERAAKDAAAAKKAAAKATEQ